MTILQKLIPVLIILAIVGLGAGGYFYFQYQKAQKEILGIKSDPNILQKSAQEETKKLIDEVGKLIELPGDEEPTVATITDVNKLKDQSFFQKAQNGDKVLIYTNAKKAIIYRADLKKVIDVAPVNIGTSSAEQASLDKIILRNGTTTQGLTAKIEEQIKKDFTQQASVTLKENATKNDYEKSVLVVLNPNAKDTADKLAAALNIALGELPQGEKQPAGGDILIIIGQDKI